jgi:hypothetical protein
MKSIDQIEKDIDTIQERNTRVEIDKLWETSWTRKNTIMILTYTVATFWLYFIGEDRIWLKAIVPVLGYLLSTLSVPQVKKVWVGITRLKKRG